MTLRLPLLISYYTYILSPETQSVMMSKNTRPEPGAVDEHRFSCPRTFPQHSLPEQC